MGYEKNKVNVKEILKVMNNHHKVEDYRRKQMRQHLLNNTLEKLETEQNRLDKERELELKNQLNGKGFLH
jgi:hypothetical protein